MRLIGRILLLIAGIALLATAIPQMTNAINSLNAAGWGSLFGNATSWSYFFVMVGSGFNILFGVIALLGALRGRKSIGLAFTALILMISPVATVINAVNGGQAMTWDFYLSVITGFGIPIVYFLGFLLV